MRTTLLINTIPVSQTSFMPMLNLLTLYCRYDRRGPAVCGVGPWPIAFWDCGFESHLGNGGVSLVSVVYCQVEVSASGWSLVQRSPTECCLSERDCEASLMRRPWPARGLLRFKKIFQVIRLMFRNIVQPKSSPFLPTTPTTSPDVAIVNGSILKVAVM